MDSKKLIGKLVGVIILVFPASMFCEVLYVAMCSGADSYVCVESVWFYFNNSDARALHIEVLFQRCFVTIWEQRLTAM